MEDNSNKAGGAPAGGEPAAKKAGTVVRPSLSVRPEGVLKKDADGRKVRETIKGDLVITEYVK